MSNPPKKLISILVPVYQEEGNVMPLHKAVCEALAPLEPRYNIEFIFTDNRSTDNTWTELAQLASQDDRVRAFRFSRNFGFQRSIFTGYTLAHGDAAVQIDCDLQDPPEIILEFVKRWEEGNKVVYGVRRSRKEGFLISFVRRVFYRLIDFLSEDRLPLDAGDFRLVDRMVVDELVNLQDARPYLRGALATLGFDQVGVKYDRAARSHGDSKFSFKDLLALAFDGILNYSILPLRLATFTGLFVFVVTLVAALVYFIGRLLGEDWPAGFATDIILSLLSLSLNALFLGVIGEYIGRIFQQQRLRPKAIIEERIHHRTSPPEHIFDEQIDPRSID